MILNCSLESNTWTISQKVWIFVSGDLTSVYWSGSLNNYFYDPIYRKVVFLLEKIYEDTIDRVKIDPQPRGHPRKGSWGTIPTSRASHQCCTHLLTMTCGQSYFCPYRSANKPCTGICPLDNYNNTGHQNLYQRIWRP